METSSEVSMPTSVAWVPENHGFAFDKSFAILQSSSLDCFIANSVSKLENLLQCSIVSNLIQSTESQIIAYVECIRRIKLHNLKKLIL